MPLLSKLDVEGRRALRARLEEVPGVRRVLVDADGTALWLLCEPETARSAVELAARGVLVELGHPQATLRAVVPADQGERRRVRFEDVSRIEEGNEVRFRVTLEWRGERHTADAVDERGAPIEMRTAAAATVRGVEKLLGRPLDLRIVGVKSLRAFDTELTVVALTQPGPPRRQFIGAVPAREDPFRTVAIAVLNALNRMLGSYLLTTD